MTVFFSPIHHMTIEEFKTNYSQRVAELENLLCIEPSPLNSKSISPEGFWSIELRSLSDHIFYLWAPTYAKKNTLKENHLSPSERQKQLGNLAGSIEKMKRSLQSLPDEDLEEVVKRSAELFGENTTYWCEDQIVPLLDKLSLIAEAVSSLSTETIPAQTRGKENPGLTALVEGCFQFCMQHCPTFNFSPYFPYDEDVPRNIPSEFCCDIAKLIDPNLTNTNVKNAMKAFCSNPSPSQKMIKKFTAKRSFLCGRD